MKIGGDRPKKEHKRTKIHKSQQILHLHMLLQFVRFTLALA